MRRQREAASPAAYWRRNEHFTDLETPMRELGAIVDVVMTVWRHPALGNGEYSDRIDVLLDKLFSPGERDNLKSLRG